MRMAVVVVSACLIALLLAVVGFTNWGMQPHQQLDHQQFCFAEWCIMPTALTRSASSTVVQVEIRSSAIAVTQRADHSEAWLVAGQGRLTGGPEHPRNSRTPPSDPNRGVWPTRLFRS